MRSRRFACWLLGMWLAGGMLLTWLVNDNLRAADRLAQADTATAVEFQQPAAAGIARLLRYEAAELARRDLRLWEYAQLALGGFFLFFMLFGTLEGKFTLALSLAPVLCVLAQTFLLYPQLAALGRLTDSLPDGAGSADRARLLVMESAYFGVEVAKGTLLAGLAGVLILRGRGRSHAPSDSIWNQFHVVDKPDHGHVDR